MKIEVEALASRLRMVHERIELAAARADRKVDDITLVAVSKGHSSKMIAAGYQAGLRVFGENYAEEGNEKMEELVGLDGLQWHMIGHVQGRKAKLVARCFDLIHSVDSLKLARRINRLAAEIGKVIPVLLEFNVSGERTKYGWLAHREELWPVVLGELRQFESLANLEIRGLMTIAPYSSQPDASRPIFQRLRQLSDFLKVELPDMHWRELSMGMSSDFEIAVEEGATFLRIGEAIFGPRHG